MADDDAEAGGEALGDGTELADSPGPAVVVPVVALPVVVLPEVVELDLVDVDDHLEHLLLLRVVTRSTGELSGRSPRSYEDPVLYST